MQDSSPDKFAKEYARLKEEAGQKISAMSSNNPKIFTMYHKYESLEDVEQNLEEGHFSISLSGYLLRGLFQPKMGKKLYVMLSGGGRIGEKQHQDPVYSRWSYASLLNGSLLNIEDPMYVKHPTLMTAWFYGTREHWLLEDVVALIRAVCRHLSLGIVDVVFYSSSSGGTAALSAAALIDGALAIAVNPQIRLTHWFHYPNFLETLGIDLDEKDPFHRNEISRLIRESSSRFVIVYNVESYDDAEKQIAFFAEDMGMELTYGLSQKENVLLWGYDAKGGHCSQEPRELFPYIVFIAQKFADGRLSLEDVHHVDAFNYIWHMMYEQNAKTKEIRKQLDNQREQTKIEQRKAWDKFLVLALDGARFLPEQRLDIDDKIGKPFLYALLRVLSVFRLRQILEFGFDVATKITSQYAEHEGAQHHVYDWNRNRVMDMLKSWALPLHHTVIRGSEPVEVKRQEQDRIVYPAFAQERQRHPEEQYDCILLKRSIVRGGGYALYGHHAVSARIACGGLRHSCRLCRRAV